MAKIARLELDDHSTGALIRITSYDIESRYPDIKSAYLYGSYAKGVASKWSDIDIAVILTDFSDDLFEERVSLMRIAAQIDDRIEPYPFLEETFAANNPLADEIQKHGIRIV